MSALSQFRSFARIAAAVLDREEISVRLAGELLKKKPQWVRENLPVIVHSPKCHHVRLSDIEAYQNRRTLTPKNGKEAA